MTRALVVIPREAKRRGISKIKGRNITVKRIIKSDKINMYGLTVQDVKWIIEAVRSFPEIKEVILFGSRAMGNYKKSSDVDLCIKGEGVNFKSILRLKDLLEEEYPLPYFFDVIHYEQIGNAELKRHIDEEGKILIKEQPKTDK